MKLSLGDVCHSASKYLSGNKIKDPSFFKPSGILASVQGSSLVAL
jgi:hypothetical protein